MAGAAGEQSVMPSVVVWIIVAVVLIDLVFVPLLLWALVNGSWNPMAAGHGAREPGPDVVWKGFQSYKVGLLNLGFMVHTGVDDRFLHLRPAWLGRLVRMAPASVPWEEVRPVRRRGRGYAEVRIGRTELIGPRWALELAFADHAEGPGEASSGS